MGKRGAPFPDDSRRQPRPQTRTLNRSRCRLASERLARRRVARVRTVDPSIRALLCTAGIVACGGGTDGASGGGHTAMLSMASR
jgi:hypothetical protein